MYFVPAIKMKENLEKRSKTESERSFLACAWGIYGKIETTNVRDFQYTLSKLKLYEQRIWRNSLLLSEKYVRPWEPISS